MSRSQAKYNWSGRVTPKNSQSVSINTANFNFSLNCFQKLIPLYEFRSCIVQEKYSIPLLKSSQHQQLLTYLYSKSKTGKIMVSFEELKNHFSFKKDALKKLLYEGESMGYLQITKRRFGESSVFIFVSLVVKNLSLEALYWIVLSIKLDEMTPSDKLIQSRIKEFYSIKIGFDEWETFLEFLNQNYASLSMSYPFLNNFDIFIQNDILDESDHPVIYYLVYPKGEKWVGEEFGDVLTPHAQKLWEEFEIFLDNFFSSSNGKNYDNINKWLCSVENQQSRTQSKNTQYILKKGIQQREIQKAIPGGKYGCCQFLKLAGPPIFHNESIGVLSKLVQKAINEKKICYFKTLLIKNPQTKNSRELINSVTCEEVKEIAKAKEMILNCLKAIPHGVLMSQLPTLVYEKLNYNINLSKLGLNKLKTLLKDMPELILDQDRVNNITKIYLQQGEIAKYNDAKSNKIHNILQIKSKEFEEKKLLDTDNNEFNEKNCVGARKNILKSINNIINQYINEVLVFDKYQNEKFKAPIVNLEKYIKKELGFYFQKIDTYKSLQDYLIKNFSTQIKISQEPNGEETICLVTSFQEYDHPCLFGLALDHSEHEARFKKCFGKLNKPSKFIQFHPKSESEDIDTATHSSGDKTEIECNLDLSSSECHDTPNMSFNSECKKSVECILDDDLDHPTSYFTNDISSTSNYLKPYRKTTM